MKQLGELVGKSEPAIGQYENGNREPDFETLMKISDVLNCSVDSILGNNYALTVEEDFLLFFFRQLNDLGKRQLIKTARQFSEDPDMAEKNCADTNSVSA